MKRALLTVVLFGVVATMASASAVVVDEAYWSGNRSTYAGITGTGGYSKWCGGLKVYWNISQENGIYTYTYAFKDLDGSSPTPDISHFILEVSPIITADNVNNFIFNTNFDSSAIEGPPEDGWPGDPKAPIRTAVAPTVATRICRTRSMASSSTWACRPTPSRAPSNPCGATSMSRAAATM